MSKNNKKGLTYQEILEKVQNARNSENGLALNKECHSAN